MQKTTKLVVSLIVVVLIVAGAVVMFGSKKAASPSTGSASNASNTKTGNATITYDGSTFEPNTLTVKKGQSVRIVNQSSNDPLSFESNPHPTHTDDDELNAGDIDPGVSKTITVTKTGTWGYHNHFAPAQSGKIIVTN